MRHEVEVTDEYSVFSVVPARSAAGWLAGWLGSQGPPTPPPLRTTCCSPVRCVRDATCYGHHYFRVSAVWSRSSAPPQLNTHIHCTQTGRRLTHTHALTHMQTHTRAQHRSWLL